MAFIGTTSQTAMWVTACIFPLFYRPIWGSLYVWTNNYIILMAAVIALQSLANSVFSIMITSLQGYLYEKSEETIFYTTIFYGSLLCIVYYFMFALSYKRPIRHEKEKETPKVFVVASKEVDMSDDVTSSAANDKESNETQPEPKLDFSTNL